MALAAATAADMQSLLAVLGEVFTYVIGKIGDVVTIVMENPLLLVPIGVILMATIIATFRKLFCN